MSAQPGPQGTPILVSSSKYQVAKLFLEGIGRVKRLESRIKTFLADLRGILVSSSKYQVVRLFLERIGRAERLESRIRCPLRVSLKKAPGDACQAMRLCGYHGHCPSGSSLREPEGTKRARARR